MSSSTSIFELQNLGKVDYNGIVSVIDSEVLSFGGWSSRLIWAQTRMVKRLSRSIFALMLEPMSVSWKATSASGMSPTHTKFTA